MDRYAVSKYRNSLMGLAILWVVFYHGPDVKIPILHHIQELGYLGVEIFFTLSGFGLYYAWNKSHNIWHFYGRRILRIIPSYFPLLFLRIAWDANSAGGGIMTILTPSFLWHHVYFSMWYVPCQMLFYVITPLYLHFFSKDAKRCTAIGVAFSLLLSLTAWGRSSVYIMLARLPVFLSGFYLAWKNEHADQEKPQIWSLLVLSGGGYGLLLFLNENCNHQMLGETGMMWYPALISTIPFILLICRFLNYCETIYSKVSEKVLKFINYCGRYSLEIYLMHKLAYDILLKFVHIRESYIYLLAVLFTVIMSPLYYKGVRMCFKRFLKNSA